MGRHAGFLAAAAALAKKYEDDGPHLIYVPERVFKIEQFLLDVKNVYDKYGRCVIAVSEGIVDEKGRPIITSLMENVETDEHGNVQLSGSGALGDLLGNYIRHNLNIKRVRTDTFGYSQRCFMGCVSDVDRNEAREVGEKAAQYALWDNVDGSITIHRTGHYSVDYRLTPLELVAGKTKVMPDNFINSSCNNVTEAFLNYARPLLGSDMHYAHRLRASKVPKILND